MTYVKRANYSRAKPAVGQDHKVLYDIRDNVESNGSSIRRLHNSVKLLSKDIEFICSILQDHISVPRVEPQREPTLPHGSSDPIKDKVLQDIVTALETRRIRESKDKRRCRVVDLHEQGSKDDAKNLKDPITIDKRDTAESSDSDYSR